MVMAQLVIQVRKIKSVLPTTSQYIKQLLIPGRKNITMKGRKINLTYTQKNCKSNFMIMRYIELCVYLFR